MFETLEQRLLLSGGSHHRRRRGHQKTAAAPSIDASTLPIRVQSPSPNLIVGTGSVIAPRVNQIFYAAAGSFIGAGGQSLDKAILASPSLGTHATIAWGDGITTEGVLRTDDHGNVDLIGAHDYTHAGTFNIAVVITQGEPAGPGGTIPLFSTRVIAFLMSAAVVN